MKHRLTEQARENRRLQQRESAAAKTADKNEIGTLPDVVDPDLRKRAMESLLVFLVEFFGHLFCDPFGEVQLSSIAHEERILRRGSGRLNKLEPRGYGKSTRSILSSIWACLIGVQNFIMVCCDSKEKSEDLLKLAHVALGENEKLLGCFPELHAFHLLDGNSHRCQYQTFEGNPTKISIKGDTIYFPILDGSYASEGAMIVARPVKKARGKNVEGRRPTQVILDDIQSSEDAISPTMPRKLLKMLTSDIALLGTRKRPVSIINNATIIAEEDFPTLVSKLKAFTTVRYKMVNEFPTNKKLWEEYQEIRQNYDEDIVGDDERAKSAALDFYKANREEMDAGSSVTWDYSYSQVPEDFEISTIQSAMNFIADFGQESFDSECQNQATDRSKDKEFLTADKIMLKQHPYGRGKVPPWVTKLVAYIDVQQELLFWKIRGFSDDFMSGLIERGTFPKQSARFFQKSKLKKKLSDIYETSTLEARQRQAILDLSDDLLSYEFTREGDGSTLQIEMCGIDSRYQTDTVRAAYQDSHHKARIQLCMGYGYNAKTKPQRLKKVRKNTGEAKGFGWFLGEAKSGIQTLEIDTNRLKTFLHLRYATALGDPGSFSLFEAPPEQHDLDASHLCAEYRTTLVGKWGEVDEWDVKPGRPDNDFLDCDVGCVAIASLRGVMMVGTEEREDGTKKRRKLDGSKWGKAS